MDCSGSQSRLNALPLRVRNSCQNRDEELLHYITSSNDYKVKLAPAYTLYLLAHDRFALNDYNLNQFLTNACIRLYRQVEKSEIGASELILWLANASELFAFFKYDHHLVNQFRESVNILENTIRASFLRLLNLIMHYFESYTKQRDFENIRNMLQRISNAMSDCHVNPALINQLYSFLLQWVGRNIIENAYDNLGLYEKYFVNIKIWATTMDDQYLMSLAEKYENLSESKRSKHQSGRKPSDPVRLNWKRPLFLERSGAANYIKLTEEGSKILSQIIKERNIMLNRSFAPLKLYLPECTFACHHIYGFPDWLNSFLKQIQDNQLCYFDQLKENDRWDVFFKGSTFMVYHLDIKFILPPCPDKKQRFGGIYIIWYDLDDPAYKNLDVGDMLFSINDKLLVDIIQKEADKIIKHNNGKVKLEVLKNDYIWIQPKVESTASAAIQTEASPCSKEKDEDEPSKPATPPPTKQSSEEDKRLQKRTIDFISEIRKKVEDLNKMLEEFDGTSDKDRNYVYMKEIMIRGIIKLDNMETVPNEEVMNMRRDTIYFIQQKTQQLMAKLKDNQEAAESKRLEEEREQHKRSNDDAPQPESSKSAETSSSKDMHPTKQFPEGSTPDIQKSDSSKSSSKDIVHLLKQTDEESTPKENPSEEKSKNISEETSHERNQTSESASFQIPKTKILVFETRYNLDSLGKASCSIGIYPHAKSRRNNIAVKFIDPEGRSIILEYSDWQLFLNFQHLFEIHFHSDHQLGAQAFSDYLLSFENEKSVKFITLVCDSDFVSLSEENVNILFKLNDLIEMRFKVIANFSFDDYFENIISRSAKLDGSRIQNVYTLVNNDIEKCNALPCACAMMEIIRFYPEILIGNTCSKH